MALPISAPCVGLYWLACRLSNTKGHSMELELLFTSHSLFDHRIADSTMLFFYCHSSLELNSCRLMHSSIDCCGLPSLLSITIVETVCHQLDHSPDFGASDLPFFTWFGHCQPKLGCLMTPCAIIKRSTITGGCLFVLTEFAN